MHLSENTKSNRSLWRNKERVLLANPHCKPELKETTNWNTGGQVKDIKPIKGLTKTDIEKD